jgi:hypothetical protein
VGAYVAAPQIAVPNGATHGEPDTRTPDGHATWRQAPAVAAWATFRYLHADAPVAQLDRALPSEGRGQGFESLRARQSFALPLRRAFIQERVQAFAKIVAHAAHQDQVLAVLARRATVCWQNEKGRAQRPGQVQAHRLMPPIVFDAGCLRP